jgi:hypothetical protein
MKRVFVTLAMIAATLVAGSPSPGLARGGLAHGGSFTRGASGVHNPTTLLGNPAPQMPTENRIPSPLASPSQAPLLNGPPARSPYGGVMH